MHFSMNAFIYKFDLYNIHSKLAIVNYTENKFSYDFITFYDIFFWTCNISIVSM